METENKIPEEQPQEGYVPRPAWQVWAARLGLVLAIATAPRATAEFFNLVLALVSAPMYCGNIWALSILLWACLFLASAEVGHHCK